MLLVNRIFLMFFVSLGTSVSLRGEGCKKQFLIEVVSLNYVVYTLVAPLKYV